ncbi:MAG TPA: hypothetical protein VGJ22_09160, partial [Anaerolineales bacterium]
MSNKQKWLIGIGVVAGLCVCAAAVAILVLREAASRVTESFKTDPTGIAEVGHGIAEYDVPPGYQESMAMSLFTYDLVAITPIADAQSGSMIMLMQFAGAANVSTEEMQRAMEQQTGQPGSQMTVVESRTEIIRGEEVTVKISESTTQGIALRQLVAMFRGNHGPTMLMIQGPAQ